MTERQLINKWKTEFLKDLNSLDPVKDTEALHEMLLVWNGINDKLKGRIITLGSGKDIKSTIYLEADYPCIELVEKRFKGLAEQCDDYEQAMLWFIDRVDRGEIKSTRTYNMFKTLIAKHKSK